MPLFWAYYLFRDSFTGNEKKQVEDWMVRIAQGQMARTSTPNNNWEAKRQKIIGTVGCLTGNKAMKEFAVTGFKAYINTAYYADGTSNDLKERDALHYHISGLTPTVGVFKNCTPFSADFDLYRFTSPGGASIQKSVAYILPYARGEIKRKEWTNSKVALDKKGLLPGWLDISRVRSSIRKKQYHCWNGLAFTSRSCIPCWVRVAQNTIIFRPGYVC